MGDKAQSEAEAKYWADKADREEEDAKKRRDQEAKNGLFDRLFSLDFGGILMLLIGGFVMWGLAQTEQGKDLLQRGISHLSPEWQANVNGALDFMGIHLDVSANLEALAEKSLEELKKTLINDDKNNEPVVNILTANKQTFMQFSAIAKEANKDAKGKGRYTIDDLTNVKTVFAMLTAPEGDKVGTELPKDAVKNLIEAALKNGGATNEIGKKFLASIQAIVKDEKMLATLVDDKHRDNTKAIITVLAKDQTPMVMELLAHGVKKDGKSEQYFRDGLAKLLTPDAKGNLPTGKEQQDIVAAMVANDPAVIGKLTEDAITKIIDKGKQKGATLEERTLSVAADTLRNAKFDDKKIAEFGQYYSKNNKLALAKFMFENKDQFDGAAKALLKQPQDLVQPEMRAQLQEFVALPPAATAPALAILKNQINPLDIKTIFQNPKANPNAKHQTIDHDYIVKQLLTNPETSRVIAAAGEKNVVELIKAVKPAIGEALTEENLKILVNVSHKIAQNDNMRDKTKNGDTLDVATLALYSVLKNDPSYMKNIPPIKIVGFMKMQGNDEALKGLFAAIHTTTQTKTSEIPLKHFDTLKELGSEIDGAELIAKKMLGGAVPSPAACKKEPEKSTGLLDSVGLSLWHGQVFGNNIVNKMKPKIEAMTKDYYEAYNEDCADILKTAANAPITPAAGKGNSSASAPAK